MSIYLGETKIGTIKEVGIDKLQWKCDNIKTLNSEFLNCKSTELGEIVKGLDTSNVTKFQETFKECSNLINAPNFDLSSATSVHSMFYRCLKLETIPAYSLTNVTDLRQFLYYCTKLKEIPLMDTKNVEYWSSAFSNCESVKEIPEFDMSSAYKRDQSMGVFGGCKNVEVIKVKNFKVKGSAGSIFSQCEKLKEFPAGVDLNEATSFSQTFLNCYGLTELPPINLINCTASYALQGFIDYCENLHTIRFYNIRTNIPLGRTGYFGEVLTLDSLIYTIQQLWDLTGSTQMKMTVVRAKEAELQNVYVKLIDITDEMRAEDQYIDNKKPCVVCESTDEGAMTILEYLASKNWTLALN